MTVDEAKLAEALGHRIMIIAVGDMTNGQLQTIIKHAKAVLRSRKKKQKPSKVPDNWIV